MPWTPADKPGDRPARSFSGYQLALVSLGSSGQLFGGERGGGKEWIAEVGEMRSFGEGWEGLDFEYCCVDGCCVAVIKI